MAVNPEPLFPGHQERGCCSHRGGFGGRTKDRRHRTKAPALCSLLGSPFLLNKMMWASTFSLVTLHEKHGRMLSCWQVKKQTKSCLPHFSSKNLPPGILLFFINHKTTVKVILKSVEKTEIVEDSLPASLFSTKELNLTGF